MLLRAYGSIDEKGIQWSFVHYDACFDANAEKEKGQAAFSVPVFGENYS